MKQDARRTPYPPAAGLGLLAVLLSALIGGRGSLSAQPKDSREVESDDAASAKSPETVIDAWPALARSTAKAMIEKYGKPNRVTDEALVWIDNGPWLKTVVFRDSWTFRPGAATPIICSRPSAMTSPRARPAI